MPRAHAPVVRPAVEERIVQVQSLSRATLSFCVKMAAIDENDELFATCTMYSISDVTPLRSPALILNSGTRPADCRPVRWRRGWEAQG